MRATVSLTFDDGLPCQYNTAIPMLNNYGLVGTFFVIVDPPEPYVKEFATNKWRDAIQKGHEIGSHSVTHCKAAELNHQTAYRETASSKEFLQRQLKAPVTSYAHPYTDAPEFIQTALRSSGYMCARGGRVARENKFVTKGDGVKPFNIPCYHINEGTFQDDVVFGYLEEAIRRQAWVTLMFHAVEDSTGWDNVSAASFEKLLEYLHKNKHQLGTLSFTQAYRRVS